MSSATTSPTWASYELPLRVDAPKTAAEDASPGPDEPFLLDNGAWFCRLRWLVVAAMSVLAAAAWLGAGVLPRIGIRAEPGWPLGVAAVLIFVNWAYAAWIRRAPQGQRRRVLARGLWLQILLDLAVLTVVIHYLGSLESYAPFMYLFHIVLACIFFSHRQSLAVMAVAMGMYLLCVLLESLGAVPPRSIWDASFVPARNGVATVVLVSYVGSVVFISATVWYLASRLAGALRQREEELAAINRRLVAATEERARHMLRTTHQLKAPFAAIHANTQLLLGGFCGVIPDSAVAVVQKIAARSDMLSREIKEMLQLANLRSHAQDPPAPAAIDLRELIAGCVARFQPQAAQRNIRVEESLSPAHIRAAGDHVVMMIENLVSNAITYSQCGQTVSVSCEMMPDGRAAVVVRDQGIGIPAEKLPHVFDDYYRTNEAVEHNKASTGLGLAIVRGAAIAGRIAVRVESAPARGTSFFLTFPASPDEPEKHD